MYNHHINHCYYGVNQNDGAKNLNQTQDLAFAANTGVSQFANSCYAHQLPSPPLEQQKESLWYDQGNSYYQQHHQINHQINLGYNAIPCTFNHNEIASPQELVLFSLLQEQQQDHQQARCHDNQLIQYDDQESSLSKWALARANFQQNNLKGGALPLSPKSMQSTDTFDSSPSIDVSCFSHHIYSQTNPLVISHLSLTPPQRQYYNHQLIVNTNHPNIFSSQSSNKSDDSQEIAQIQYQQQFHQTKEQQQEHEGPKQQQQQQPKQRKKTTRKRASRSQLQCTTCFKTFSRPYNLKSHQRTHTKERPFLCLYPDCGWTFARPHDLKRHELLHSGVKPFQCVCGKRFARSDAYKRHQSVDIKCAILALPQQRKRKRRSDAIDHEAS